MTEPKFHVTPTQKFRITDEMVKVGVEVLDANFPNNNASPEWKGKFIEEIYLHMRSKERPYEQPCPSKAIR